MLHRRTLAVVLIIATLLSSASFGFGERGVVRAQGLPPDNGSSGLVAPAASSVAPTAAAVRQCLSPTADAMVQSYNPDTNYGTASTLQVASIGDVTLDRRWSYLQFDLSGLPDDAVVLSASLELYLTQSTYGGTGYLVGAKGSWTEADLTWTNQPSLDTSEYDSAAWGAGASGWQTWQARDLVYDWLRGRRPNYGVAVTARGLGTYPSTFDSRDTSTGLAPRLCITWEPYTDYLDADAIGWASGRNYSSSAFGQWFDEMSRDGYMMVDIEVDEIDGQQRVGGVWQRNTDGRDWLETRNMTLSTFESYQQTRADAGYRMIDQETYVLGTTTYYAGIWISDTEDLPWVNYYDVTSAQFETYFNAYSALGLMPIDVDAYVVDGELLYSAIWLGNIQDVTWYEHRNLTSQEFANLFDQYQGTHRMIDVESYMYGGQQYYAGIWVENTNGRGWAEYRDMTSKAFHETWASLRDAGYRLIDYEVYPTSSGWRYAGIWRQNSDRPNWALKDDVDTLVEDYFANADLPGMSVAVAQNGEFRYLRGLGHADVDDDVATDSRTIYRLASISKAVGGVIGVRLSQDGLLNLEAPSADYIPGLPVTHTHTVSQTLTNRSGIGHYSAHPSIVGSYATALAAAQKLWNTPLLYAPGTGYTYSTHAYTFAGASMEDATGLPIRYVIEDYVQTPYGLTSLRAEDRSVPNSHRSLLYKQTESGNEEVSADNLSWKVLGGGLESSVYDLVRFGMRLTDGTILSPSSLDVLWTPPDNLRSYALGWDVGTQLGRRVVAKMGNQNGATGYIRIYPDDDIVIAVLTNRKLGHNPRPLARNIGALMLNAMSAASISAPTATDVSQAEMNEPAEEAVPAEYVVWPESAPTVDPTAEDLRELETLLSSVFLPLVIR